MPGSVAPTPPGFSVDRLVDIVDSHDLDILRLYSDVNDDTECNASHRLGAGIIDNINLPTDHRARTPTRSYCA